MGEQVVAYNRKEAYRVSLCALLSFPDMELPDISEDEFRIRPD